MRTDLEFIIICKLKICLTIRRIYIKHAKIPESKSLLGFSGFLSLFIMQLPTRKPGKYSIPKFDPVMSAEKLGELKVEFDKLKKKRPHASKEVARLAEMGDFSENVEYQLAKRRLRGINSALLKLEYQIDHANVIKPRQNWIIEIGHTVKIKINGKEKTYTILGSSETNPEKGIISHTSPIGSALLGKRSGDIFDIEIGGRSVECVILGVR